MRLKLIFSIVFGLSLVFLLGACAPQPKTVCNPPYLEWKAGECCLDADGDGICDSDKVPAKPQVKYGKGHLSGVQTFNFETGQALDGIGRWDILYHGYKSEYGAIGAGPSCDIMANDKAGRSGIFKVEAAKSLSDVKIVPRDPKFYRGSLGFPNAPLVGDIFAVWIWDETNAFVKFVITHAVMEGGFCRDIEFEYVYQVGSNEFEN